MRTPAAAALALLLGACASAPPAPPPAGAVPEGDCPGISPQAALEVRPATPVKDYPLDTCVVSGESLAMMGEPVAVEVDGVVIHLCCNHCVADVRKDPARYVSIVKALMRSRTPEKQP